MSEKKQDSNQTTDKKTNSDNVPTQSPKSKRPVKKKKPGIIDIDAIIGIDNDSDSSSSHSDQQVLSGWKKTDDYGNISSPKAKRNQVTSKDLFEQDLNKDTAVSEESDQIDGEDTAPTSGTKKKKTVH